MLLVSAACWREVTGLETMTTKKLYEAMFLIDSAQAGSDWEGTMAAVNRVLERADAETVYLEKWVDRRLAFEIAHKARGTYILCYFKAEGSKIAGIEKDVNLSEQIMRVLVLTAEERPGDSVKKDLAGETKAPQEMYVRDDRRPGSRRRDNAPPEKAGESDKTPAAEGAAEAPKDVTEKVTASGDAEPTVTPKDAAEKATAAGDAEPTVEATGDSSKQLETSVDPRPDVPTGEATGAGDAGSDTEPEKD